MEPLRRRHRSFRACLKKIFKIRVYSLKGTTPLGKSPRDTGDSWSFKDLAMSKLEAICTHPKSTAQPFHILPQRIPTKTCMMRRRPGVKKSHMLRGRLGAWRLQCLTKYLLHVTMLLHDFTSHSSYLLTNLQTATQFKNKARSTQGTSRLGTCECTGIQLYQ